MASQAESLQNFVCKNFFKEKVCESSKDLEHKLNKRTKKDSEFGIESLQQTLNL